MCCWSVRPAGRDWLCTVHFTGNICIFFIAKTLQEPDYKIKSSICLAMISSLGGLPNLLAEGRTWWSSCAFLFIQRWCLYRDCLLLFFFICFRRLLSSPWESSFPVSLTVLAEGIDGAASEGINYLLAAEAFQSNWMKTKGQETRLCFRFTDCSSASFWAL